MSEYEVINRDHTGPLIDPTVEYTAQQAIRMCRMKRGSVVLDYGCSVGRAAKVFQEFGCVVYGVDVVRERLEKATGFCQQTFLRERQSEPLPYEAESVEFVFSSQVIEHLHRRDGDAFLKESWSLLKNGGRIFLTTPNPHYLRVLIKRRPMIRASHLSSWIIEEMEMSLVRAGFGNIVWRGNGRMAKLIGDWVPCRWIYGGYAMVGEK